MTAEAGFDFQPGRLPLLVSVPHDGRHVPAPIAARMTDAALALPDTDWHVARLYDFCRELGAAMLIARHSRYVVDLNRPPDDASLYPGQLSTGLCPLRSFSGEPLYRAGHEPGGDEIRERVAAYWKPYHDRLASSLDELVARHGHALLWDAHSIASEVPLLFDGRLPVLNIGTNGGASAAPSIADAVDAAASGSGYSRVVNGRFRGGFITRHYGDPANGRHAIQLELAQRAYMDEASGRYDDGRAARARATIRRMLEAALVCAAELEQRH